MKSFYKFALTAAAAITLASCSSDEAYEFAYLYEDLPFEMEQVQRPQIPEREVNIVDFGGVGDGVTLNSDAFAKAIEIDPGIVVGRLQKEGYIDFSWYNDLKTKYMLSA